MLLHKILELSVVCTLQLCDFISSLVKVERWPGCFRLKQVAAKGRSVENAYIDVTPRSEATS